MTVAELISLLQQHPPDTRVVVRGYESGVDDVVGVDVVRLQLNARTEWWNGDHVIVDRNRGGNPPAVYLRGRDKQDGGSADGAVCPVP